MRQEGPFGARAKDRSRIGEELFVDRRKRRVTIRIKRKLHAKRKLAAGFKKVVEHRAGRRKVRFVKPA
jgi:hypothetical protein